MSEDSSFEFNRGELLAQLMKQREQIRKQQKISLMVASELVAVISIILAILTYASFQTATLSIVAVVAESGTILVAAILIVQFDSLRREIRSLIPAISELKDIKHHYDPSKSRHIGKDGIEILAKIYDINKNTLDKLFDKLRTFSNTWLAVSGGIASTLFIEIFKSETLNFSSAITVVLCSVLVWSIAQDAYGILNYELAKKTKDLGSWWVSSL